MGTKIGIIGSGVVGKTLAGGFLKHGYEVTIGSRSESKLKELKSELGEQLLIGSFDDAASFGDIIVLAVKGTVAVESLKGVHPEHVNGKIVIDTNNPIADAAPVNGVIQFFTDQNGSLLEQLQSTYPEVHFVKAFSCVGSPFMVNPSFPDGKPSMFIAGNNENAKKEVSEILDRFGWEIEDMGTVEAARAIEPLCMLWCIPGLKENSWNHAFKLLKM